MKFMNLTNLMKLHTLKMFNSGQITLPKSWREKFATKSFLAEESAEGLLIKPLNFNEVMEYENEKEFGLFFPKGIDPKVLMDKIKEIDG